MCTAGPKVGSSAAGVNGSVTKGSSMLPELGASLAVQHAGSYRVVAAGDTATMHEHVPDQSELRCGFVLELSS